MPREISEWCHGATPDRSLFVILLSVCRTEHIRLLECHDCMPTHNPGNWSNAFCTLGAADKKIIVWNLHDSPDADGVGFARRALTGHSQCVQDVVISSDSNFALSGSWDKTLRLWDLNMGETVRTFQKHTSDVNSVAFSADNRQIVSGSRDRTVRLWNTLADCKYTIEEGQHTDWVSCVRFSPSPKEPLIVSCGWDKLVKVCICSFLDGGLPSVPSISFLHGFETAVTLAERLQGHLKRPSGASSPVSLLLVCCMETLTSDCYTSSRWFLFAFSLC